MFSHVNLSTRDPEMAAAFYDSVLEPLGIERRFTDFERGWAGWQHPDFDRPIFVLGLPINEETPDPGNGQMVAFNARERQVVDQCHANAIKAGGSDEGAPGLRPEYHENYYGAYFRDLDGNKICVCCHQPA